MYRTPYGEFVFEELEEVTSLLEYAGLTFYVERNSGITLPIYVIRNNNYGSRIFEEVYRWTPVLDNLTTEFASGYEYLQEMAEGQVKQPLEKALDAISPPKRGWNWKPLKCFTVEISYHFFYIPGKALLDTVKKKLEE